MNIVRLPSWSLGFCKADYYGYRYAVLIGPWLVFLWRLKL